MDEMFLALSKCLQADSYGICHVILHRSQYNHVSGYSVQCAEGRIKLK